VKTLVYQVVTIYENGDRLVRPHRTDTVGRALGIGDVFQGDLLARPVFTTGATEEGYPVYDLSDPINDPSR
jgi:hypothetical protein